MGIFTHSVSRRFSRKAFNLIELLIVLGIITLLATLLLPTLNDLKSVQVRARCQVNMKSIAAAANFSAIRSESQSYPAGSVGTSAEDEDDEEEEEEEVPDDYTNVSPGVRTELNLLGVNDEAMICQSIGRQDWMFTEDIEKPFKMGIIYWLGREDILDPDDAEVTLYESRARRDRAYDFSSSTLVTCMAYDSHTTGTGTVDTVPGSIMPHIGADYSEYPYDHTPNPWEDDKNLPDGLVVGTIGGSADFVWFGDLTPIDQLHKVWYK